MTTVVFTKAHAAQADYIVICDPDHEHDLTDAEVATLCDRRGGVGGLGVVLLSRSADPGASAQPPAGWSVEMRRHDGAPMFSPDGLRIAAEYLLRHELVPGSEAAQITLRTARGPVDVRRGAAGHHVDLGRWQLDDDETLVNVARLDVPRPALIVTVAGQRCAVIALAGAHELDEADLRVSPDISAPGESAGAVCLVAPDDPLIHDATGRIRVRTYEAGLGEVSSGGCGAAAACLATRHWASQPHLSQWRAGAPGGQVHVRMFPTEEGEHVALSGPAVLVFDGEVTL